MRLCARPIHATNLHSIFDRISIFKQLQFPCGLNKFESDNCAQEQSFRDLIRERIEINNKPVNIDSANIPFRQFKHEFQLVVEDAIRPHVHAGEEDPNRLSEIAVLICCHLSRTRSGGDSLFAIRDLLPSSLVGSYAIKFSRIPCLSSYLFVCVSVCLHVAICLYVCL